MIDSDGTGIIDQYTTGYWTARARNSLATADYMLNLDASGFGPYPLFPETRIIKRTATGDWILAGNHVVASGSVLCRNGLNDGISDGADGTHYAAGRPGPGISTQPSDQVVCDGGNALFTVSAQGAAPLTYKWYKEPATPLNDNGKYTGPSSNTTYNLPVLCRKDAGNIIVSNVTEWFLPQTARSKLHRNHITVNPLPDLTFGYNYITRK